MNPHSQFYKVKISKPHSIDWPNGLLFAACLLMIYAAVSSEAPQSVQVRKDARPEVCSVDRAGNIINCKALKEGHGYGRIRP